MLLQMVPLLSVKVSGAAVKGTAIVHIKGASCPVCGGILAQYTLTELFPALTCFGGMVGFFTVCQSGVSFTLESLFY